MGVYFEALQRVRAQHEVLSGGGGAQHQQQPARRAKKQRQA